MNQDKVTSGYHDLMDGPVYYGMRPGDKWYDIIAPSIPSDASSAYFIREEIGLPVEVAPAGSTVDVDGHAHKRMKMYVRMFIPYLDVEVGKEDVMREHMSSAWRKVGAAIRERHPEAVRVLLGTANVKNWSETYSIFMHEQLDGFGLLGRVTYFAIPAAQEAAQP